MRNRLLALSTLALGVVLVLPPATASAKSISPSNLKSLRNSLQHAKHRTYFVTYTSVSDGKTTKVTFAQKPPKSYFSASGGSVINNGKTTYYCSSTSGSTDSSGSQQCLVVKGSNPLLGLQNAFSPAVALSALAEAKQGLASKALGIKVASSSAKFGGQRATCVTVKLRGHGGKYCVTKQGILAYSGSSSGYFKLVKYSSKPPASLFELPAGATTQTLPGGVTVP